VKGGKRRQGGGVRGELELRENADLYLKIMRRRRGTIMGRAESCDYLRRVSKGKSERVGGEGGIGVESSPRAGMPIWGEEKT